MESVLYAVLQLTGRIQRIKMRCILSYQVANSLLLTFPLLPRKRDYLGTIRTLKNECILQHQVIYVAHTPKFTSKVDFDRPGSIMTVQLANKKCPGARVPSIWVLGIEQVNRPCMSRCRGSGSTRRSAPSKVLSPTSGSQVFHLHSARRPLAVGKEAAVLVTL